MMRIIELDLIDLDPDVSPRKGVLPVGTFVRMTPTNLAILLRDPRLRTRFGKGAVERDLRLPLYRR